MKIKLFLFALIVFPNLTFAQAQGNITGKYYITNVDLVVKEFNLVKKDTIIDSNYIAEKDLKFTAYETKGDQLIIKFWDFGKKEKIVQNNEKEFLNLINLLKKESISNDVLLMKLDSLNDNYQELNENVETYKKINKDTDGKYFVMNLDDFNQKVDVYNGSGCSFVWGFSIIPIKLRFGTSSTNFKYNTGFSLGVNVGYEVFIPNRKKQSAAFLFGVGISSVEVEPFEVNNLVTSKSNESAFTPSLGMVYSYENFQIGIFSGIDYIAGEMGSNWIYKNKPWLGVGLGFTIFQKNNSTGVESEN